MGWVEIFDHSNVAHIFYVGKLLGIPQRHGWLVTQCAVMTEILSKSLTFSLSLSEEIEKKCALFFKHGERERETVVSFKETPTGQCTLVHTVSSPATLWFMKHKHISQAFNYNNSFSKNSIFFLMFIKIKIIYLKYYSIHLLVNVRL